MERLAFEILTILMLGAALGAMLLYAATRLRGGLQADSKRNAMEFRFSNGELVGACRKAQRSLTHEDLDGTLYDRLMCGLTHIFPDLRHRVESNSAHWDNFTLATTTSDGPIEVDVTINDTLLTLRLSGIHAPLSKQRLIDADAAEAAAQELQSLHDMVNLSPFPTWREQADGTVEWANAAYKELCGRALPRDQQALPRLFHGGQVASTGQNLTPKRSLVPLQTGDSAPFEVARIAHRDKTFNYASDASKLSKAEEQLGQFMQTLTQTFAALPIGLAVFDRARNLVMFNPVMADLTTLDPCWLSARPSLHDVIDRLRDLRMIPERRDFTDWRSKIAELEASAVDGTYCETWSLPNGQTYRFTGRPHPEGAVAFLIEDITAEISLTRKFRRELALSQALIDNLPDAMVVFAADGVIAMTNTAYHELWNTDPEDALDQLTITDATRLWQMHSTPNPVWGDARDFATQGGERVEWSDTVSLTNGRQVECWFQPLVGGATLVEFRINHTGSEANAGQSQLAAVSS